MTIPKDKAGVGEACVFEAARLLAYQDAAKKSCNGANDPGCPEGKNVSLDSTLEKENAPKSLIQILRVREGTWFVTRYL